MKILKGMAVAMAVVSAMPASASELTDMAWLAGTWEQNRNGTIVRETWLAPAGDVMAGIGQTLRPGKKAAIEFMKISLEPGGLTFTGMPEGQAPTPFVRIPGSPGKVVFENKAHDFPQRVIYERCGEDLCARIEGTVEGKLKGQDWRYHRVPAHVPAKP
jgi:hypothetical protein